jgi:lactoylglutathione lyase
MITGFFHASFVVSDLDRSIDFYTNVLGMKVAMRTEAERGGDFYARMTNQPGAQVRLAYLEIAGRHIELIELMAGGGGPAGYSFNNVGAAHIAFHVDDVRKTYEELRAKGVRFASEPQMASERSGAVYAFDPDGNVFELMDRELVKLG